MLFGCASAPRATTPSLTPALAPVARSRAALLADAQRLARDPASRDVARAFYQVLLARDSHDDEARVGLARLGGWACDLVARTRLPDFPFKPDTWFVFGWRSVLGVLVFGVAACVLAALRPAWRAAKIDPAAALSGGVG